MGILKKRLTTKQGLESKFQTDLDSINKAHHHITYRGISMLQLVKVILYVSMCHSFEKFVGCSQSFYSAMSFIRFIEDHHSTCSKSSQKISN